MKSVQLLISSDQSTNLCFAHVTMDIGQGYFGYAMSDGPNPPPVFLDTIRNVTVRVGDKATLLCQIANRGTIAVSILTCLNL